MAALLELQVLGDQAVTRAATGPPMVELLGLPVSVTVLLLTHYGRDAAAVVAVTLRELPATAARFLAGVVLQGRGEFSLPALPVPETALALAEASRFLEAV
jgi:hypothetical protein